MASYDRSAQKKEKKSKKKDGGGQKQVSKRKYYSDMIPFRKIANMLQSSGSEYVAKEAVRRRDDPKTGDGGLMLDRLEAISAGGIHGEYGERVQRLACKAFSMVK